jgi:hypothetical protein
MEFSDRLGVIALIMFFVGLGITILWPTKDGLVGLLCYWLCSHEDGGFGLRQRVNRKRNQPVHPYLSKLRNHPLKRNKVDQDYFNDDVDQANNLFDPATWTVTPEPSSLTLWLLGIFAVGIMTHRANTQASNTIVMSWG